MAYKVPNPDRERTERNRASNQDNVTPSGLQTLLNPVAADWATDPQPELELVARDNIQE